MKTLIESCQESLSKKDLRLVDDILWLKEKCDELSNHTGDFLDAFVEQVKKELGGKNGLSTDG